MGDSKLMDSSFGETVNNHIQRYKVLKEKGDFEACIVELEKVITLLSGAIVTIFGKSKVNYTKPSPILLEGIKNVTLDDVLNPDNIITINAEGNLKIKK